MLAILYQYRFKIKFRSFHSFVNTQIQDHIYINKVVRKTDKDVMFQKKKLITDL